MKTILIWIDGAGGKQWMWQEQPLNLKGLVLPIHPLDFFGVNQCYDVLLYMQEKFPEYRIELFHN